MKFTYPLFIFFLVASSAFSQQPFNHYGYRVNVATLSQGKYQEDFSSDSLVQVGSVVLNRITGKIVLFVTFNSLFSEATLNPELISRWMSPDPLAEKYFNFSPYNFVQNNPINRIDPTGLTDFALNKKTGQITRVSEANDDPDRILKTKGNGEVKYKKNGEARVAIGGIEKGILNDGQNFKTDDQAIDVGGEGQPSLGGVEDFVTKFSEYVGVEIAGAYLSPENSADAFISKVVIDEYQGNESKKSTMTINNMLASSELKGYNTITAFHTHPSNLNISRLDVERPSGITDGRGDLGFRDGQRSFFYYFLILTRTATYPSKVQKIDYTNWKR